MTADHATSPAPTGAEPTPSPEKLMQLLSRQRDLYQNLKALSDDQGRLIADGETEQLLSLLARRQGVIEQLSACSLEISPHRAAIAALAGESESATARQVRTLVDDVRELLESIIQQDDAGRREMEAARDEIGSQLRQTAAAPSVLGAYGNTGAARKGSAARFTDQRG
ncbi:MAG: flagellar export chaperone FlgN [Phycisphaerales bacterium JB063]